MLARPKYLSSIKALKAVPCPAKKYLCDTGEMFHCSPTAIR